MLYKVPTMSIRSLFRSRIFRITYVALIFLIPALTAGMLIKYWHTHAADPNGSTLCDSAAPGELCISSIEGVQITASNNPGGYTNNTPSVSPDNGINFSPAFGAAGTSSLITVNGKNFPDPTISLPIEAIGVGIGSNESYYLSSDGQVYKWSNVNLNPEPMSLPLQPDEAGVELTVGTSFACLLTNIGGIYCWSAASAGTISNWGGTHAFGTGGAVFAQPTPMIRRGALPANEQIISLQVGSGAATSSNMCGLSDAGNLYCMGVHIRTAGIYASEVSSTDSKVFVKMPRGASPTGPIKRFAWSGGRLCIVASDNHVYCAGSNSSGALGNNTTTSTQLFVPIYNGSSMEFIDVSVTGSSTCGILDGGQAYCWGANLAGQLGNGTTADTSVPIAVAQDSILFKSIHGGGGTSTSQSRFCAITVDDALYCWGYRPVGNGTSNSYSTPTQVKAQATGGIMPDKVTSVTSTSYDVCAIADDKWVYCWTSVSNRYILTNSPARTVNQPVKLVRMPSSMYITFDDQYGKLCPNIYVISSTEAQCGSPSGFSGNDTHNIVVAVGEQIAALPNSYYYATYPEQDYEVVLSGKNNSIHIEASHPTKQLPYFTSLILGVFCQYSGTTTGWYLTSYGRCSDYYSYQQQFHNYWPSNLAQYDVVGLRNGTSYKIATQLISGSPNYSLSFNTTVPPREFSVAPVASAYAPDKPTITQVAIPITISSCSTLSMSWQPPAYSGGSPITNYVPLAKDNYNASYLGNAQSNAFVGNATSFSSSFCPTTSADGSVTTSISVVAVNANGASEPSDPIEIAFLPAGTAVNQPPNVPTNIKVNNVNNSRVMLSFPKPYDNGSTITSYEVRYSTLSDFSDWVDNTANTCISNTPANNPTAACLTEDLAMGGQYYFQVRALSANGASDWSIIHSSIVGAPDRPVLTDITAADAVIDLTWNVPNDNGATITRYALERATNADFTANLTNINLDSTWISTHCNTTECNYYHDDGLINGTTYYYRVTAENSRGLSPTSDWLADTPYAPPVIDGDPIIAPDYGYIFGNEIVTILGTNFNGTTAVSMGGTPCKSFSVVDAATIICLTPAHAASSVDVSITNMGGTDTVAGIYTYIEPERSLALTANSVSLTVSANGNTYTGTTTANVKTDDPRGYRIAVSAASEDNALIGATDTIPATGRTATAGALEINRWGYSAVSANNTWLALPKLSQPKTIFSSTSPTTGGMTGPGENKTIYYGIRVDLSKPIGVYTTNLLYTLTPGI